MSAEQQNAVESKLSIDNPSIAFEGDYHNQKGALDKLRTLREDHQIECSCVECRLDGTHLAADEDALKRGELDKTRDYLKDTTAYQIPIGKRSELKNGEHQTEWHKSDIFPTYGIDRDRWRSMWLFQSDQMGKAPVENRWTTDTDSNRETTRKLAIGEALSNELGCISEQRKRTVSILKQIDAGCLGAHSDNRKAAMAAVSLVTREEREYGRMALHDRMDRTELVHRSLPVKDDPRFQELCDEFGFNPEFLKAARESIEKQL